MKYCLIAVIAALLIACNMRKSESMTAKEQALEAERIEVDSLIQNIINSVYAEEKKVYIDRLEQIIPEQAKRVDFYHSTPEFLQGFRKSINHYYEDRKKLAHIHKDPK